MKETKCTIAALIALSVMTAKADWFHRIGGSFKGESVDTKSVSPSQWDERRRIEHEDYERQQRAIRERQKREDQEFQRQKTIWQEAERKRLIEFWESTDWSRKDYEIALRVIEAYKPADILFMVPESFGPYTKRDYEKAKVIKRVYEEKHPEEFDVPSEPQPKRREPVRTGTGWA